MAFGEGEPCLWAHHVSIGVTRRLEPMAIAGTVTYGNYFTMRGDGRYRIVLTIREAEAAKSLTLSSPMTTGPDEKGGFWLIAGAWRVLYAAQQHQVLATMGPYAHVRHPQYVGFVLVMLGFLLQWPTLLTLAMFPLLVWMYVHLARPEEREVRVVFGEDYAEYARRVPAFVPRVAGRRGVATR